MFEAIFNFRLKMAFSPKEREKLYRKLAQLMHNGVSLDRSIEQLYNLEIKRRGNTVKAKLFKRWRTGLNNGVNFGACITPFVPPSEAMLIETGSDSGFLEKSLINASNSVAQQRRVKAAIIGSAAYPVSLILMLMAALSLASYKIIPSFEEVLPSSKWQGMAYNVAQFCGMIREHGIYMIGGVAASFIIIGWSLPRWTGRTRLTVEKLVPWSIYRMWQGSSFLLSIASLMTAGVKLDGNSLNRLGKNASPYMVERIRAVAFQASSGMNLGEALDKTGYNFPDDEIIADIRVYATLKGFEDNLITITSEWVDEVEEKVKNAMKVLNFLALFLIATTIGMLISALFNVMQQIQTSSSM